MICTSVTINLPSGKSTISHVDCPVHPQCADPKKLEPEFSRWK